MNDDMFARLVAEDVRGRATETQLEYLHLPQNRDRWKRALLALIRNVDQQIERINEDKDHDLKYYEALGREGQNLTIKATQDYDSQLSKREGFKFYVNKRLDYVVTLEEDKSAILRANFLEAAILRHKSLINEFDMEPTEIDVALWASLDNKWEFDNISSSG